MSGNPSADDPIFSIQVWYYQRISPKGQRPCRYLESPTNLSPLNEGRWPHRIITRENGGTYDNHVQWIRSENLVVHGRKGTALAHGVLLRDCGEDNKRGDKVWLLSEYPLNGQGGSTAHVVNLDKNMETQVSIGHVKWRPDKRLIADRKVHITFSGPLWPGAPGVLGQTPYKMCVLTSPRSNECLEKGEEEGDGPERPGVYVMVRRLELELDYEDMPTSESDSDGPPEGGNRRGITSFVFGWLGLKATSGGTGNDWASSSTRRNSAPQLR